MADVTAAYLVYLLFIAGIYTGQVSLLPAHNFAPAAAAACQAEAGGRQGKGHE